MFRRLLIVSLLILSMGVFIHSPLHADGQEQTEAPKPEIILSGITYIQEIPPEDGVILNKNILFIFDCSGSMDTDDIQDALTFFIGLSSQPIDQMQFAVLAFDSSNHNGNDGLYRWPGIPELDGPDPVPEGWAALPSAEAIQKATSWINNTRSIAGGGTDVVPAIQRAYQEPRDDLSIILVTDGGFNRTPPENFKSINEYTIASLKGAIKTRQDNKELTDIAMMVYGVGAYRRDNLAELAKLGGAGYYRRKPKPVEENEDGGWYGPH